MTERLIHYLSLALVVVGLGAVTIVYLSAPKDLAEAVNRSKVVLGVYSVDKELFDRGLSKFRSDDFSGAISLFDQADPEKRDARTQFYIAYSYYRQGWGRISNDDESFAKGLEAAAIACELDPDLVVDDASLQMRTPEQLRSELESGLKLTVDDLNPLKLFRERK
jgi:hypothetical protein